MSTHTAREGQPDARATERILVELLQLSRELMEFEYVQRSDALERVRDAVRRLEDVGSPQAILQRAADELGASSQFDRVLISEVLDGSLQPRAIWARANQSRAEAALGDLGREPTRLDYPLIEEEVARRQRVEIVSVSASRSRPAPRLAEILAWDTYVVAALTVHGRTVGLLHADAASSDRALGALDAEIAARYTEGLASLLERAVLRKTLQLHRRELHSAIQWMSGRLSRLAPEQADWGSAATRSQDLGVADSLTPRELEVLRLLARGQTNQSIANTLVVRVGTVKYHVKNILRKLGATSRADAISRYVRAGGSGAMR